EDEGEDPIATIGVLMSRAPSSRRSRSPLPIPSSARPSRQSSVSAHTGRSPLATMTIPSNIDTNTLKTTVLKDTLQESPKSIRSPLFEDHIPPSYIPGSL